MRTAGDLAARLWEKTIPEPNSGCVIWLGKLDRKGYGEIGIGKYGKARAHRIAYELERGPIPTGLTLDHLCRVKCCVNPWHLEPVTALENFRRATGLPVAIDGFCLRGHPFDEANTYRHGGIRHCRACRKMRQRKEWRR